jgi:glyoxylase-like metal-dependent hydrolase (beta-lactamase superfamily II)
VTEAVRVDVGGDSPEGSNSAYVLPDRGTVIDPGPPGDAVYRTLRAGIADAGLALSDVEHVVVTHWHVDHAGLAPRLAAAADAAIHMHERDAPLVAEYAAARLERIERDAATLADWGVPDARVREVRASDAPSPMPDATPVERHRDGDVVAGGEVLHTPGHTEGHLAFRVGDSTFVGDAVLPTYTPNVGGSDTRSTDPLAAYVRSLATLTRRAGTFYPGHGSSVAVPGRIETILEHHRDRARRTFDRLDARGEATPWEVARDLFGEMRGVHVKFGAGEAAAHLRSLASRSHVRRIGSNPQRFAVADAPTADEELLPPVE